MINLPTITTVSVLSRRPVPMAEGNPKVKVIIHRDFNNYPSEILEQLKGANGCVWAQGISVTQVSKEEYERITFDYPLAAAKAFSSLSSPFKFVYVSGEGATTTPGMFTAHFGVVKGRAEAALLDLSKTNPTLKPYSLRPGGIDPASHPEIHKFLPERKGMTKLAEKTLLPVLRTVMSGMVSPTKELARVLTDLAMGEGNSLEGAGISGEGRTINNAGMRRIAGI